MGDRLREERLKQILPALAPLAEQVGLGHAINPETLDDMISNIGLVDQEWAIKELQLWHAILTKSTNGEQSEERIVAELMARGVPDFPAILAYESAKTGKKTLTAVGVCGRSCSGKGAATSALASTNLEVLLVQADWYFYPDCSRRCVYNGYVCIEHTNAIDSSRLVQDLNSILHGMDTTIRIETPWLKEYAPTVTISGGDLSRKRVVLVDGFLSFAVKELVDLLDYRLFVDASDQTVASRRLKRDGNNLGYDYIWNVVIPVSKEYESLQKGRANVIIDGEASPQAVVWAFVDSLNKSGAFPGLDVNRAPWEVHFGDLVQDTVWHPIAFDNLKDWAKHEAQKGNPALYDSKHYPFGLSGNNFRYRKNSRTDQWEVRLSSQNKLGTCRYTREDSPRWQ